MSVRVGVITYLKARGLGYDARSIRSALAGVPDLDLSFFPAADLYRVDRTLRKRKLRPAPVSGEWAWPEAERRADLATWVGGRDVILTLEVFLREVAALAFAEGIPLIHVPNLEWISDREGWATELGAADLVLAKTEHTVRALEGAGLGNVRYVPFSVPLEPEPPRPTRRPVIFFHSAGLGGSHDPKNPGAVLAAFAERLGGREDARLVLKSQVPLARRKVPVDLAPYRGLENLTVIERDLPYDEVLLLTRAADVAVYPSRAEGLGLPLLEALALGAAVITTDAPPMNEIVRDGENGLLVPGRERGRHRHVPLIEVDREALGDALERLTDPSLVDRLKAGAARGLAERNRRFREGLREAIAAVTEKR